MLEETTTIRSKAIFSDDKEHRLLLRKEWDSEKPTAMVIMINPNTADTVNFDMTTMLVLNNVSKLGREPVQQNHGKARSPVQRR